MTAIAILSHDQGSRGTLELLPEDDASLVLAGTASTPTALLRLAQTERVDVLLAAPRSSVELFDWSSLGDRFPMIVILDHADEAGELDAFKAGARAVFDRTTERKDIVAAINAVARGFVAARQNTFRSLLDAVLTSDDSLARNEDAQPILTPRELEVLAAMADGLSNKAIARRLEISVHTAKFHVASILEKLGADTRTEAVTRAAQRGIVML
jgi:DNA-binding NarL/FixJ family response regulator